MISEPLNTSLVIYTNLLKTSLRNVLSLRLQSLLTLITMSVGAFTLSATLFIGDGAMHSLWKDLETLMGNWMIVLPEPVAMATPSRHYYLSSLHYSELDLLRQQVKSARYIEPLYSTRKVLSHKNHRIRISVDGITAPLLSEELYRPMTGTIFSTEAMNGFTWDCYLTQSLYREIGAPLLQDLFVKLDDSRFRVVAVTPDPPEADELFSKRLILPYAFAEMLWGEKGHYGSFAVGWLSMETAETTLAEVRQSLDGARGPGTYHLSSSLFKLRKRKDIVKSFVMFGKTQALFSILIASIGILNVMLASVVHKMREFAIRITLGATQKEIFFLVVSESICYAILGSCIGVLLAVLFSADICRLVGHYLQETKDLLPLISLPSILLPLSICSFCGLVAGITPAFRAIRVDTLSILRAE